MPYSVATNHTTSTQPVPKTKKPSGSQSPRIITSGTYARLEATIKQFLYHQFQQQPLPPIVSENNANVLFSGLRAVRVQDQHSGLISYLGPKKSAGGRWLHRGSSTQPGAPSRQSQVSPVDFVRAKQFQQMCDNIDAIKLNRKIEFAERMNLMWIPDL